MRTGLLIPSVRPSQLLLLWWLPQLHWLHWLLPPSLLQLHWLLPPFAAPAPLAPTTFAAPAPLAASPLATFAAPAPITPTAFAAPAFPFGVASPVVQAPGVKAVVEPPATVTHEVHTAPLVHHALPLAPHFYTSQPVFGH